MTESDSDQTDYLVNAVLSASRAVRGGALLLVGQGSRLPHASAPELQTLTLAGHRGVIDYRPEELVLQARTGTPLSEIVAELDACSQRLPFDPPAASALATLGGAVATGWSGPGRPWLGALRDAVLGVQMVNGLGEALTFGGQVVKNVAGYDLSRLQVGAWGTLGPLLSVSLRTVPKPEAERHLCLRLASAEQALAQMRQRCRESWPLSGMSYQSGCLHLRLAGAEASVRQAAQRLGGEPELIPEYWTALRDHALAFFQKPPEPEARLWEVRCAPAAPLPPGAPECWLLDWAGARRWWWTARQESEVAAYAASAGGQAQPARATPQVTGAEGALMARIKSAFDPRNIFNPHLASMFPQGSN